MKNRILFCNIAYMQYYDFDTIKEIPKHGGKYVAETGDALEKYNFQICDDEKIRGFVETKYRDSYLTARQPNRIRIENIDSNYKKEEQINDVIVVFCAHSDKHKKSVIVGWYKNATVYRNRVKYNDREFNLECHFSDAYLVDENQRDFIVPRAAHSEFGLGQSNVWYAKDERSVDFVKSVLNYIERVENIDAFGADQNPMAIPEEYRESGIGKKILVNRYERNNTARRKCLETYGTKCVICGFSSAEMYGEEFKNKIEVHHIVPINEINKDYKVDPVKDLVPVCPNCHMILHSKMSDGSYPTVDLLKKRMKTKDTCR